MGDTPENSYWYWSFRKAQKKEKKEKRRRGDKVAFHWLKLLRKGSEVLVAAHFLWKTGIVMRSHVTPDTFCSEMATYQSSGLKIRMDGGLSTLSRDRKSWDKSISLFLFHFIKFWILNIDGRDTWIYIYIYIFRSVRPGKVSPAKDRD